MEWLYLHFHGFGNKLDSGESESRCNFWRELECCRFIDRWHETRRGIVGLWDLHFNRFWRDMGATECLRELVVCRFIRRRNKTDHRRHQWEDLYFNRFGHELDSA